MATIDVMESIEAPSIPPEHKPMTPPTSEEGRKPDAPHSDLSDLDLDGEDDDEEIEPAYYYDGGKIPVFEPVSIHLDSVISPVHLVNVQPRLWINSGTLNGLSIRLTITV